MRDKSRSGEQAGNVSTTLHAKLWPRMPVGRANCSLGHLEPFLFSRLIVFLPNMTAGRHRSRFIWRTTCRETLPTPRAGYNRLESTVVCDSDKTQVHSFVWEDSMTEGKPGRNARCWCGSGRKYKKCHLDADAAAEAGRNAPSIPTPRDIFEIRESILAPKQVHSDEIYSSRR